MTTEKPKIHINEYTNNGGEKCYRSWGGQEVRRALDAAFSIRDHEKIVAVEVGQNGIQVTIEKHEQTS